nr:MAG TPA: hypothetical protein [Caudoviricetes sp.]
MIFFMLYFSLLYSALAGACRYSIGQKDGDGN